MPTTAEIGVEIADQIEERGHYQGPSNQPYFLGAVCVITADPWPRHLDSGQDELASAICNRAGLPIVYSKTATPFVMLGIITHWNDNTPTNEVLNVLRSL